MDNNLSTVTSQERDKHFVVLGIFETRAELDSGIEIFRSNGFQIEDISALIPWPESSHEFAHKAATKAPEGAATGMAAGALAGGAFGWLIGVGALAIPGLGTLLAAGPIVSALAGMGLGSAAGSIAGGLLGMGIPEYEAKRYEGQIKDGGFLISIHCADKAWRDKAKDLLDRSGALNISTTHEARSDRIKLGIEPKGGEIPPSVSA